MHDEFEAELHALVLNAIQWGRAFGEQWDRFGPLGRGVARHTIPQTVKRLHEGQVFQNQDQDVVEIMGEEIRRELNELIPSLGDRAMLRDTSHDFGMSEQMTQLSHLIEAFKAFRRALQDARDHVLAFRTSEQLLEER